MIERFAISVEKDLLAKFEKRRREIGYTSRSEAVKDLIRNFLISEKWRARNERVIGIISVVYDHGKRALPEKLIELQHRRLANIVSSMHIHIDTKNCLEVIVLKGRGRAIRKIANEIKTIKAVKHLRLIMTGTED